MDASNIARCFGFLACVAAAAQEAPPVPVFHLGPDIAPPFVVAKAKPEYTDEARLAKLEGSVLVSVVVDAGGQPREVRVERPLGLGLDESAVENVRHWQFRPGTKAGNPVAVEVKEEVFFRTQRSFGDWHAVRVVFHLPEGGARPVVIQTKFPPTIDEEENASVRIAFDVGPKGIPTNVRALKSSKAKWEAGVVAAVREGWRFRPGTLDGKAVTVPAWFDFVRGSHSPIPLGPIPDR